MVAVVVYVVVAVACNGSGGCICIYVRAGGMLSYLLRPFEMLGIV